MIRNKSSYINHKNIIFKASFLAIVLVGLFLVNSSVLAAASSTSIQFTPQIGIPNSEFQVGASVAVGSEANGKTTSDLMARYISAFYNWSLTIVAVIAILMLMAAGLLWLTSGGDSERINQAKKLISNSLLGSALLISSWFLLHIINPNLTSLPVIETVAIRGISIDLGCCEKAKISGKSEMTTSTNCQSGFYKNQRLNGEGKCSLMTSCGTKIGATCLVGHSVKCPDGYTSDMSGGKSCLENEKCCYKNESGLDEQCGQKDDLSFCQPGKISCPGDLEINLFLTGVPCGSGLVCCYLDANDKHGANSGSWAECGSNPGATCIAGGKWYNKCPSAYSPSSGGADCKTGSWCCFPK